MDVLTGSAFGPHALHVRTNISSYGRHALVIIASSLSVFEFCINFIHEYSKEEVIADVLLWKPKHGKRSQGRRRKTYTDQLLDDTGCRLEELPDAMEDRVGWKKLDLMMMTVLVS